MASDLESDLEQEEEASTFPPARSRQKPLWTLMLQRRAVQWLSAGGLLDFHAAHDLRLMDLVVAQ